MSLSNIRKGIFSVVVLFVASTASAQFGTGSTQNGQLGHQIRPIQIGGPIFDYWVTPAGSSLPLEIPRGFFGTGSVELDVTVQLVGEPFGPGQGQGLPPNADTSIRRQKDPNTPQIGDVGVTRVKFKGISLVSVTPITVTYNDNNIPDELWDVHIELSDLVGQTWGQIIATKTFDNGGTFDSVLPLIWKATFTQVGGSGVEVLDAGDPGSGLSPLSMGATSVPYVQNFPGNTGNFHPGYNADMSAAEAAYAEFSSNEAHYAGPCGGDCPDDGGGGGVIIIDPDVLELDPRDGQ